MRLPYEPSSLHTLCDTLLRAAILERRNAIRDHRDAIGDARCWLDDWLVWKFLIDTPSETELRARLTPEAGMEFCRQFHARRNATTRDPTPHDAILDPAHWDDDLASMGHQHLAGELFYLQCGIKLHRNSKSSLENDRSLYGLLPEMLTADFRLGTREIFLGEQLPLNSSYGCAPFWHSHRACQPKTCNLHQWGQDCRS